MKKPFLDLEQRQMIYANTLSGDIYMVNLKCKQLIREIHNIFFIGGGTLLIALFIKEN